MYKQDMNTPRQWPEEWKQEKSRRAGLAVRLSAWLRKVRNRALIGAAIMVVLFLAYRAVWLTGWYWPYRLLHGYLTEQLPMAAPWLIDTLALLLAALIAMQGAALVSFVLWGRHRREMLALSLAGIALHGGLGWYGYGRNAVDDSGRVVIRVVETPTGRLKVVSRNFDPETGRPSRPATAADLVMLDLQRRGLGVKRVGRNGPFRTAQGTICVYYTRQNGRIALYNGPRHRNVSGEMPLATEDVIREFLKK